MLVNIKTKQVTKDMLLTIINDSYDSDLDSENSYYYTGKISYTYILNKLHELYKENDNTLIGETVTEPLFTTEYIDQLREDIVDSACFSLLYSDTDFEDMATLIEAEVKPDYIKPLSIFKEKRGLREEYEHFEGSYENYQDDRMGSYMEDALLELNNSEYVSIDDRSYGGILLYGTIDKDTLPNKDTRIIEFNENYTLLDTGGNDTDALEFGTNLTNALKEIEDVDFKKAVIEFFVKNTTRFEYNLVRKLRSNVFNYYITELTDLF